MLIDPDVSIPTTFFQPPPVPRGGILERMRLLRKLERGLNRRVILLSAPTGYGKTILLNHWIGSESIQRRYRTAWLNVDDAFCDQLYFFAGLLHATSSWLPEGTYTQIRRALQDTHAEAAHLLRWLLRALEQRMRPSILILDDVHMLEEDPESLNLLSLLLRHSPTQLRVVLTSRTISALPVFHRLRIQKQIMFLDLSMLRFTVEEVQQLFGEVFSYPISTSLATALVKRTEGWPVALSLIREIDRSLDQEEITEWPTAMKESLPQLYDYLAAVVFEQQTPALQRFLLRTSIVEDLRPALCNALSGYDDAARTLRDLEQKGLFTFPVDEQREVYRYHNLFRGFLHRHLVETESPQGIHYLHREAARYYLDNADDQLAIHHFLAAQDYDVAADLLRPLRQQLFSASRYHKLASWLDKFPKEAVKRHPWILVARGRLLNLQGAVQKARILLQKADALLTPEEDSETLYELCVERAWTAHSLGHFSEAEDLYLRSLVYAVDDAQRAVVLGRLARYRYLRAGKVEEAMCTLDEALTLVKKSGHPFFKARLLFLKGNMLSNVGDFAGALDAWHTSLDLYDACGGQHQQITILSNVAYHYVLLGDFAQAETFISRAITLAEYYDLDLKRAYSLNVHGCIYTVRKQWEAAWACYEEALVIQRRIHAQYEIPVTLNWMATLARYEGNFNKALRLGKEALTLREDLGNEYEIGLSLIDLGAIYLALERIDEARCCWQRALGIFSRHKARYERAQLHYYLAVLALKEANEEQVFEHLSVSLRLAHGYGESLNPTCNYGREDREMPCSEGSCLYFFVAEAAWTVPLLLYALRRNLEPLCVDCLLVRLGEPTFEALISLLDDPAPAVRARAVRLLGCREDTAALSPLYAHRKDPSVHVRDAIFVAQERLLNLAPEPLHVQTLGNFRLWRGEREITEWPRRSARDVFLQLLVVSPRSMAGETLAETLWPHSLPDKSDQNLRRAVSDLRRTLEPDLPPRLPSRYVHVADEMYTLRLPAGTYVTDMAFEEEMTQALNMTLPRRLDEQRATIATLENILSLYIGDYMADYPFEEWTLARREYLRHLLLRGSHKLAHLYLEVGDFDNAIAAAHTALTHEHWDEEATHLLMQAYAALGNVPAALRAYETLRDRMRSDLDLPPRADLVELYQRLRR